MNISSEKIGPAINICNIEDREKEEWVENAVRFFQLWAVVLSS